VGGGAGGEKRGGGGQGAGPRFVLEREGGGGGGGGGGREGNEITDKVHELKACNPRKKNDEKKEETKAGRT